MSQYFIFGCALLGLLFGALQASSFPGLLLFGFMGGLAGTLIGYVIILLYVAIVVPKNH